MRTHKAMEACMKIPALIAAAIAMTIVTILVHAEVPGDFLSGFETGARASAPGFKAGANRGAEFFRNRHGGEWSCSSCHTDNPGSAGRHASTGKPIQPLAPGANPQRLTDPAKVEKWFRRNCRDVLGRECTAQEKADVVAWLISIR
jgi:Domain of unknown function (DUF1924)